MYIYSIQLRIKEIKFYNLFYSKVILIYIMYTNMYIFILFQDYYFLKLKLLFGKDKKF